jgi:hypothetical protein
MASANSKDHTNQRLQWAITAALSSPLLDDIQGFAWEAVFHYAKQLRLRDPLTEGKSKKLFDAVDSRRGIGWSLKAKQCGRRPSMQCGMTVDFVIQRADVYSKAGELGFPTGLNKSSPVNDLGRAVVALWNNKVRIDMAAQRVREPRLAVLLKSDDRKHFGFFEVPLPIFDPGALAWGWTTENGRGLQGREGSLLRLKWYPSGTQLFQCLQVPPNTAFFDVEPRRVPMDTFVEFIGKLAYR